MGRKSARFATAGADLREAIEVAMGQQALGSTMLPISPKTFYRVMEGESVNIGSLARLCRELKLDPYDVEQLGYLGLATEMRRLEGASSYNEGLRRSMEPRR